MFISFFCENMCQKYDNMCKECSEFLCYCKEKRGMLNDGSCVY